MARILALLVIALVVYIIISMYRIRLKKSYSKGKIVAADTISFRVSGYTEEQMSSLIHTFLEDCSIDGAYVQSSSDGKGQHTLTMPVGVKTPFTSYLNRKNMGSS